MGKDLKWLAQLKEDGQAVKTLEAVPEVFPHALWLWQAFTCLSLKRTFQGNDPQPIPMAEIAAYAAYHAIPPGAPRTDLADIVGVLDQTYLEFFQKRAAAQRDKDSRRNKRSPFKR